MNTQPTDEPRGRSTLVNRRQLLRLAGGVGLAGVATACANPAVPRRAAEPATPPGSASGSATESQAAGVPTERPAPAPIIVSADLLCRDAWGARPPRPGGRPHTITRMTIHHSGVALDDNRIIAGRFRQHQRYHLDTHGWIDIAYHVGIDRDGHVFELRAPELAGDTATDYDPTGHFLVLCEGDFDRQIVSEAQFHGAAVAFAWAAQNFHITTDTLASHRDVAPATACPGANLYARVASGELKRHVDGVSAVGRVDLRRICGPEAAAMVAAIEAGR